MTEFSHRIHAAWILSVALLNLTGEVSIAESPKPKRPNIIVILSDDMGFSDIGCYGGEIQTPQLDALAGTGIRFTQFYNTARCCPTRASLLTGLYPHQAGIGHMMNDNGHEGYRGDLNRQCVTIAEVLGTAGYRSYMCGKWHITRHTEAQGDKSNWPLQRGFEKFYGTITGAGSFYDPATLCRQNTLITPQNDPEYQPESFYYTDALSDNAAQFLEQHHVRSPSEPFFLYLAYTCAHWPMHALERDIAKYEGKYEVGYESVRTARYERMKKLGILPADSALTAAPESWNQVSDKKWEARCMEVYAAMIDSMDQGIGRVVTQLKKDKVFEDTLILFLQDNGGCAEGVGRQPNVPPPAELKPFSKDELQKQISPPMQTRDGRWVRTGPGIMPGPPDTYIAYGRSWANVSNTPFREYKHWVHEGGISTPLIAHWPAGIPANRQNVLENQPGHLIDIMATCIDVSGAVYPTHWRDEPIKPYEGISLMPAFRGTNLMRSQPIFWEHEGNRAVREGKWKLVAKEGNAWELYDIERDRTELRDLAQEQPQRVKDLEVKWNGYAARANVLPLGGWRRDIGAKAKAKKKENRS